MKIIKHIGIVLVFAFAMEQFLPWWSIAIAGGIGGIWFSENMGRSFLAGFLGIFLLWTSMAFILSASTGSELPGKFAQLLPLPLNGTTLALVAGLIGGIVGGFASMSGDVLRSSFMRSRK